MHPIEDWGQLRERYEAWWAGEGAVVQVYTRRENAQNPSLPPGVEGVGWLLAYWADRWVRTGEEPDWDEIWRAYRTEREGTAFLGDAFPGIWLNFGPGAMAAYLEGYAEFRGDTVWFELPKPLSWEEIRGLDYDPNNSWWQFTLNAARELGKRAREEGLVIGTSDIGGVHDVLASLRGSGNLMADFYDHPQELQAEAERMLDLWQRYYDELDVLLQRYQKGRDAWMHIYSDRPWYPIQCDLAYMLSPRMFEEFVLPIVEGHCRRLERTVYHLDGVGQLPHLEMFLEIEELDGIQWVPGAGKPTCGDPCWFQYYRRIQEKGKLLVLGGVLPEQVDGLVRALKPEGVLVSLWVSNEETAEEVLRKFRRWM